MTITKSIRLFLARHFGLQKVVEDIPQISRSAQRQTKPRCNPAFGGASAVSNYCAEGQANSAGSKNTILDNQVGGYGLNSLGVCNIQSGIAELNRLSTLACGHRQLLLLIDENGEAYDMAGRKWSLAA